nr:hypothetical protein [Tanacetum cinerariifolium]
MTERTSNSPRMTPFCLIIEEVATGNNATTSFMQEEGRSYTPIIERINVLEKRILDGKLVFVDDDGKPLELDYLANFGYNDEVEPVDNETTAKNENYKPGKYPVGNQTELHGAWCLLGSDGGTWGSSEEVVEWGRDGEKWCCGEWRENGLR